jgi:hypothetical protein
MSDRTTITRLTRQLAATRQKLKEAQEELKWRRKKMRPTPTELRQLAQSSLRHALEDWG